MGYKEEMLRKLIRKLQAALEDYHSIEIETMCNLEQMEWQVLTERDNLVTMEEMTLEYTVKVNANLDSEEFRSHTMNRFAL